MSRGIITALLPESLRRKNWYTSYVLLVGQLSALARFSEANTLPDELKLPNEVTADIGPNLPELLAQVSEIKSDSIWRSAWRCDLAAFHEIPAHEVDRAIHSITTAQRHRLLRYRELTEALIKLGMPEHQKLPDALTALLIELLEPEKNSNLYMPDHRGFAMLSGTINEQHKVYLELPVPDSLAAISSLLSAGINLCEGDPISDPGWFTEGQLQVFDYGLAILTREHRYRVNEVRDIYGRFDGPFRSKEALLIEHMLQRCTRRVVIAVPGTFLQKNTEQQIAFRRKLVQQGRLQAVIKLPKGLLPGKAAPLYLLIGGHKTSDQIIFVNADRDYFKRIPVRKKGSARIALNNADAIVEYIQKQEDSQNSCLVSRQEILSGDITLDPAWYRSEQQLRLQGVIQENTLPLESVVTIIRAQAVRDEPESGKPFIEVTIGDINEAGEVDRPERVVNAGDNGLKRAQQQQLQAGDILLAIKGQAGRVGIVPELCGTNWIANQAFVILRLKDESFIKSAAVLFRFFRSESGRQLINKICVDNNVPFIHGQDLKHLPIPQWSELEQRDACQAHKEILKLYAQMSFIRDKAQMIENSMLKET